MQDTQFIKSGSEHTEACNEVRDREREPVTVCGLGCCKITHFGWKVNDPVIGIIVVDAGKPGSYEYEQLSEIIGQYAKTR